MLMLKALLVKLAAFFCTIRVHYEQQGILVSEWYLGFDYCDLWDKYIY